MKPFILANKIHWLLLLLSFFFSGLAFGQGSAIELGYLSKHGSGLKTGYSYRVNDAYHLNPITISASYTTNFSSYDAFALGIQKRFLKDFEGGLSISNKDLEPTVGINFLNALKIHVGYSLSYQSQKTNWVTFGFTFALGTKNYYDHLRLGF